MKPATKRDTPRPLCGKCGLDAYWYRGKWRHRAEMVIPRHEAEAPRKP